MRIVADTNTVLSGLLWQGPPRRLINLARQRVLTPCTSSTLLAEFAEVIARDKFAQRVLAAGLSATELVQDHSLNSPRAVEMTVYVVRAFVHLCELLSSNRELARGVAQLETRLDKKLTEHDRAIGAILSAIRELMHPQGPVPKRRPISFTADLEEKA